MVVKNETRIRRLEKKQQSLTHVATTTLRSSTKMLRIIGMLQLKTQTEINAARIALAKELSPGRMLTRRRLHRGTLAVMKPFVQENDISGALPHCVKVGNNSIRSSGPFDALADELIEMVVDNLPNPKDRFNCWRACNRFTKILEPTKTVWAFHRILPFIAYYIPTDDLLKCRQVCIDWKQQVDEFVEGGHCRKTTGLSWFVDSELKLLADAIWTGIYSVEGIGSFRENVAGFISGEQYNYYHHHDTAGSSPFRGKTAVFQSRLHNDDEYWRAVLSLLDDFGKSVRACYIGMYFNGTMEIIKTLRECLVRIPNVKKLSVSCNSVLVGGIRFSNLDRLDEEMLMGELEQYIEENPFPELKTLENLCIMGAPGVFYNFAVRKYSQQLQELHVAHRDLDFVINAVKCDEKCGNMNSCNDKVEVRQDIFSKLNTLGVNLEGTVAQWPLYYSVSRFRANITRLELNFENMHVCRLEEAFDLFSAYEDTLKKVKIKFPRPTEVCIKGIHNNIIAQRTLSNVNVVELIDYVDTLDILFCFPSIRFLSLLCTANRKQDYDEAVERLREGEGIVDLNFVQPYTDCSNIWDFFPLLEEIALRDEVICVRDNNKNVIEENYVVTFRPLSCL